MKNLEELAQERQEKTDAVNRRITVKALTYYRNSRVAQEITQVDPVDILPIPTTLQRLPKGITRSTHGMLEGTPRTYVTLSNSFPAVIWQSRFNKTADGLDIRPVDSPIIQLMYEDIYGPTR